MSKFCIKTTVGDRELLDMLQLDKENYAEEDQGVYDTCKQWLRSNPDIYTCIYDGAVLCGYVAFMPITRECYARHIRGEIKDSQITSEDVLPFAEGREHYCLLASLVVDEKYRGGDVLFSLLDAFCKRLNDYDNQGIKIKTIIADCVNPRVEKFVRKSGFKQVIKNEHCNIYEGNI